MMMLLLLVYASCVVGHNFTNWPKPSSQTQTGLQSERDISYSVPIDQFTSFGVSLTSSIFRNGYTSDSTADITTLLDVGARLVHIDLYYNTFVGKWQLCPAPFPSNITSRPDIPVKVQWDNHEYYCQPDFTPDSIMSAISSYLSSTNTNMAINYLQVLYSVHEIKPAAANATAHYEAFSEMGNATLAQTVGTLGSGLFTPADLRVYQSSKTAATGYETFYNQSRLSFPGLEQFLLQQLKRVVTTVINPDDAAASHLTTLDSETVFIANATLNATIASPTSLAQCAAVQANNDTQSLEELALKSRFRFAFDSDLQPFNNDSFSQYITCGFSPILNATSYNISGAATDNLGAIVDHFIPSSFWSWRWGQPLNEEWATGNRTHDGFDASQNDQYALRCVAIDGGRFEVQDCYQDLPYVCKDAANPFKWVVRKDRKTYFDVYRNSGCPEGSAVGVPKSSLEMLSLVIQMAVSGVDQVWIDLNDVTVRDCFVTGGPYATCPYQHVISTRKLAGIIAPVGVVAVVVVVLIFIEQVFRRNPIQTNRKRYWKKVINDYYKKNDSEGVPS